MAMELGIPHSTISTKRQYVGGALVTTKPYMGCWNLSNGMAKAIFSQSHSSTSMQVNCAEDLAPCYAGQTVLHCGHGEAVLLGDIIETLPVHSTPDASILLCRHKVEVPQRVHWLYYSVFKPCAELILQETRRVCVMTLANSIGRYLQ